MCVYSLAREKTRRAIPGEPVVTNNFGDAVGFAGVCDRTIAVCMPSGTELGFNKNIDYLDMSPSGKFFINTSNCTTAILKEMCGRDVLEFPDGKRVPLSACQANQYATVLQLPASQKVPSIEAQMQGHGIVETGTTLVGVHSH
jgi:hypothetical protein